MKFFCNCVTVGHFEPFNISLWMQILISWPNIPPPCKAASVSLSIKHTLKHNCNAFTKLSWDFAIVISIDQTPGHVDQFGISLWVQELIPWSNSPTTFEKRHSRYYRLEEGVGQDINTRTQREIPNCSKLPDSGCHSTKNTK